MYMYTESVMELSPFPTEMILGFSFCFPDFKGIFLSLIIHVVGTRVTSKIVGFFYGFSSVLLMNVEPDGPLYELPVLGSVVSEMAKRQATPIVLSDRCFIYFGGVGAGKTM